MNTLFLGIVIFLIVLAVFDLVVGVSNDAVNFLNSAIGAKVARYRTRVKGLSGAYSMFTTCEQYSTAARRWVTMMTVRC